MLQKNIPNKITSIKMFSEGMFGNNMRTWYSRDDVLKAKGLNQECVLRYMGTQGGSYCHYNVTVQEAFDLMDKYIRDEGAEEKRFYFNDHLDDTKLLIQGEVMESHRGLELRYSHYKKPMRIALANGEQYTYGVKSKYLLRKFLTPVSYDNLMETLDAFPGHVIEFSTWSYHVGNVPGCNTIIWEVRNY